jgi:hypothetical protein
MTMINLECLTSSSLQLEDNMSDSTISAGSASTLPYNAPVQPDNGTSATAKVKGHKRHGHRHGNRTAQKDPVQSVPNTNATNDLSKLLAVA